MNSQLREQLKLTRQILEKRGSFLPSTMDEPPEESQPPDRDKLEDDRNFDQNNLCYNIEPVSNPNSPYIDVGSPLYRNENHFNISGISGLATKTSYLMFLIQSILQTIGKDKVAVIIFNVKQQDLLHINEQPIDLSSRDLRLYGALSINPIPFDDVLYFLPRGVNGRANSEYVPTGAKIYAYEFNDVWDRLDLLFSDVSDPEFTIASIISEIREKKERNDANFNVNSWLELQGFNGYPREIRQVSVGRFNRHLRRLVGSNPLFPNSRGQAEYLGDRIRAIKGGQTYVIDIARISSLEEQAFIIGDVMKNIDQMYLEDIEGRPEKIIILIDELNRYVPRRPNPSAVAEQIIEIARTGRSRGTILAGAQQFKSAVHQQVHENSGTHVLGRMGASELSMEPYTFLDRETKMNVARLGKGELVLVHSTFRQPVKIVFPKPAYKRQESMRE